jgi:hypothetical protein
MRRGRLAKLRAGQLLPWSRPPYGYQIDPQHPRDPTRVRADAITSVIVQQIFAWYLEPQATLYQVTLRLSTARPDRYWQATLDDSQHPQHAHESSLYRHSVCQSDARGRRS